MHRSYLYPHNLFIFAFLEKRDAFFCSPRILSWSFQKKTEAKTSVFQNCSFERISLTGIVARNDYTHSLKDTAWLFASAVAAFAVGIMLDIGHTALTVLHEDLELILKGHCGGIFGTVVFPRRP